MSYVDLINKKLKPQITDKEIVVDLFARCGGLALGFEAAGYKTIGYEMNADAAETYRKNLQSDCATIELDNSFEYLAA